MNSFNYLDFQLFLQLWLTKAIAHFSEPYTFIEALSAACALMGSLLVALKGKHVGAGWILFACSNVGWIVFARGHGHMFFLVQQIGFSITSTIGIWQYMLAARWEAFLENLFEPQGGLLCSRHDWRPYFKRNVQTHVICARCNFKKPTALCHCGGVRGPQ